MNFSDAVKFSGKAYDFAPDGTHLAIASGRGGELCSVRDASEFTELRRYVAEDTIDQISWSPDSQFVLCACLKRGLVHVFSLLDNSFKCRIDESTLGISAVVWSPDSRAVLVTSEFAIRISVWSLVDGSCTLLTAPKNAAPAKKAISFSPDGKFAAILARKDCKDHVAIVSTAGWQLMSSFETSETRDAAGLAWCPSGRALIAVWDSLLEYKVAVYRTDGVCVASYRAYEDALGVRSVAWSPTGQMIAVASYDNVVRLLNHVTWRAMCEYSHSAQLDVSRAFVFREKLSPAPECLPRYDVTTSEDPDHRIADMTQVIGQPDQPNPKVGVSKIEWSADARYLASKSDSFPNTIWIWDTAKLRLSAVLVHVEPVRSFVWHPRETLLAICTASPNIYMWTPDGASCAKSPSETAIVGLQWNPVGSSLLVTERTAASMCWLSLQSGQDDGTASEGAR